MVEQADPPEDSNSDKAWWNQFLLALCDDSVIDCFKFVHLLSNGLDRFDAALQVLQ